MANAFKCDLCGEFFTNKDHLDLKYKKDKYDPPSQGTIAIADDICEKCIKKIIIEKFSIK